MDKAQIEAKCKNLGITDKGFIATVKRLYQRIETCKNLLYREKNRASWEYVIQSKPAYGGMMALNDLNGGYNDKGGKYIDLWKKYCLANDICWDANFGDWMA